MDIISKIDFLKKKKSDLVIIYGSGPTIGKLSNKELDKLSKFDSIGFNWFCKSNIPTTFYIIREQATTPKRCSEEMGITPMDLIKYMNNHVYINSSLVIQNMTNFPNHNYAYSDHLSEFKGSGIVLEELRIGKQVTKSFNVDHYKKNIFNEGIYHGKCSLSNAIHLAIGMKYKEILFIGVDLYDSRYFWRGDKKYLLINNINNKHKVGKVTIPMLKEIQTKNMIEMCTYNKKSLLSGFMPIWKG